MRTLVGLLLFHLCAGLRSGKDGGSLTVDTCTCLSWKDVYANGSVACGDAFELASKSQWLHGAVDGHLIDPNAGFPGTAQAFMEMEMEVEKEVRKEYCMNFFMKIPFNDCIKVASTNDESEWYGKSWCYVPSQCQSLNGGVRVEGKSVSAKFCTEAEDDLLSEKSIYDLATWANDAKLEYGLPLTVKLAYPYMGENFTDISDLPSDKMFSFNKAPSTPEAEQRRKTLAKVRATRKPVVYDTGDHASKKRVILGSTTYAVDLDTASCIKGCTMQDMKHMAHAR